MKAIPTICIALFAGFLFAACHKAEYVSPERRDLTDVVFASGNIFYFNEYNVVSNTDGYIRKILKRQNDSVKVDDVLFIVNNTITASQVKIAELNYADALAKVSPQSPTLRQKEEQVALALKQMRKDSVDYERNKRLLRDNAVSVSNLEDAEIRYQTSRSNYIVARNALAEEMTSLRLNYNNTKKQLDIQIQNDRYNYLTSGIDGVLAILNLNEGDLVTTGVVIGKVTGGTPRAKLFVDEIDINRIRLNQKVLVSLNTMTDSALTAVVSKIYPSFDLQNQAFVVEATFVEPSEEVYLFTQTQLQANIVIGEHKQSLVIPTRCLVNGFVEVKGEREPRKVKTGIVNDLWTEVLSGLSEKEILIVPKAKQK